jgi:hypothetical protein
VNEFVEDLPPEPLYNFDAPQPQDPSQLTTTTTAPAQTDVMSANPGDGDNGGNGEDGDGDLIENQKPPDKGLSGIGPGERYDPSRAREWMRGGIAGALLAILAVTVLLPWLVVAKKWLEVDDLESLLSTILTPLVGLVGAVTGFYFGERSSSS